MFTNMGSMLNKRYNMYNFGVDALAQFQNQTKALAKLE